jgi:hypothetical protein
MPPLAEKRAVYRRARDGSPARLPAIVVNAVKDSPNEESEEEDGHHEHLSFTSFPFGGD